MDVVGGSWRSDLRLTSEGADQDWRRDSGGQVTHIVLPVHYKAGMAKQTDDGIVC